MTIGQKLLVVVALFTLAAYLAAVASISIWVSVTMLANMLGRLS